MSPDKKTEEAKMITLDIDGQSLSVPEGFTVLQACEQAGVEIPRFCYHEKLSIAGNCRMCLVEIAPGPPKPQASCALPVGQGMKVKTNSPLVEKARKGVLEFLLVNHPLDCPICDQGGECDLQDQTMGYGPNVSRFRENKRAVGEKYMGPLIKTFMTRCIHCTRCVRFASEVAGVEEIGMLNRGENVEITTLEKTLDSELSANVIDLCPVGALTSKPYAFKARAWELEKTESIDVSDAVGANIRIDSRSNEVMRILPRLNEAVNEEWISDKARYFCDGLTRQRLDRPWLRNKRGRLEPVSWEKALEIAGKKLTECEPNNIAALAGDLCDVEAMFALKNLLEQLDVVHMDCRQDGADIDPERPAGYLFNSTIAGIEESDYILIVGANPRREAAIINARIRKAWLHNNAKIAAIGLEEDLRYPFQWLGEEGDLLDKIASGEHPMLNRLKKAKKPSLILGAAMLARHDGAAIHAACCQIAEQTGMIRDDWKGFNMLHHAAGRVGGLEVGFVPQRGGWGTNNIIKNSVQQKLNLVWLLGADELDMDAFQYPFVIYQGHHGDAGAQIADLILPGAAFSEKNGIWVNTEGRVQYGQKAVLPPGEAKEDWTIIRKLSEMTGTPQPWNNLEELREALFVSVPHLAHKNEIRPVNWESFGKKGNIQKQAMRSPIENFYMTDPISRISPTMAECVKSRQMPLKKTGSDV